MQINQNELKNSQGTVDYFRVFAVILFSNIFSRSVATTASCQYYYYYYFSLAIPRISMKSVEVFSSSLI